jgi:trehalose 6-phosphate synthase/phosphatase
MIPVHLSRAEVAGFYRGYSNTVLWPALHDMDPVSSSDADWDTYRAVNVRFADAVVRAARPGDLVWIHDYHLMLVPRLVRQRVPTARIGFFLHTPFPHPESFARLPHAATLLDGLLDADSIGVHTEEYADNFIATVGMVHAGARFARRESDASVPSRVFVCPISVDVAALGAAATSDVVAREVDRLHTGVRVLLGIDRLDYTKGIPHRLRAFERLLESDDSVRGAVRFVQIAVPSREDVAGYGCVRREVEDIVQRINDRWGRSDWQPVDYRYGSVGPAILVALYRAADVMVVTPLRDGLNLVAKEFAAARVDEDGVLILSERAGAAAELRTALLVDPHDEGALASAYATALAMRPSERRVRMRHMRSTISRHDVHRWAERALAAVGWGARDHQGDTASM